MDNYIKDVPQLLEKNNTLINKVDKLCIVASKVLMEKQKAEIPPEELDKLKEVIQTTSCAAPDPKQLCSRIADGVVADVREDVKRAVTDTVQGMRIKLEHKFCFGSGEDRKKAEKVIRFFSLALSIALLLLVALAFYNRRQYLNSEEYWGAQYLKILNSEYATEQERDALLNNTIVTGRLPEEFRTNPDNVKERIHQNQLIIKDRKKQEKKNKGWF